MDNHNPYPLIEEEPEEGGYVSGNIVGHRIAVRHIAFYVDRGYTAQEIIDEIYPHLNLEEVEQAIGYYKTHKEATRRDMYENSTERTRQWTSESPRLN